MNQAERGLRRRLAEPEWEMQAVRATYLHQRRTPLVDMLVGLSAGVSITRDPSPRPACSIRAASLGRARRDSIVAWLAWARGTVHDLEGGEKAGSLAMIDVDKEVLRQFPPVHVGES